MRISDWSSDVCSSDLIILGPGWSGTPAWQDKWRGWQAHNLMGSFQTLVSRDDISEQLSRIAVPALVVHGDSDAAISLDRARDMATRLPRAEWVAIGRASCRERVCQSG